MVWASVTPFVHNGSMKRFGPPLAVLLALGLGACGSTVSTSSFKGEAHAVAQRISDLQSDVSAVNEQKICEQDFSRAARARLTTAGNTCKQALKRQLGTIDAYELTVQKVAVSGATATARVQQHVVGQAQRQHAEARQGRRQLAGRRSRVTTGTVAAWAAVAWCAGKRDRGP